MGGRPISVDILSTGQVAKLCHVSAGTAKKWMDSGMIQGAYRLESSDRRVPRQSVIAFMREHGIPELDE